MEFIRLHHWSFTENYPVIFSKPNILFPVCSLSAKWTGKCEHSINTGKKLGYWTWDNSYQKVCGLISPELNILHFSCAYPLSFYTTLMWLACSFWNACKESKFCSELDDTYSWLRNALFLAFYNKIHLSDALVEIVVQSSQKQCFAVSSNAYFFSAWTSVQLFSSMIA